MLKKVAFLLNFIFLLTYKVNAQETTLLLPFTFGSHWNYLDNGSDQGTAWLHTDFNDSEWKSGYGKFGYGTSDLNTIVSYGDNDKKKHITTYFRTTVHIPDRSIYTSYKASIKRDDGVVVYVNGVEVYRDNMPGGSISYTTTATEAKDNGQVVQNFSIPAAAFQNGYNVIAVELHQQRANSPDVVFDMALAGETTTQPQNQPPTVSISSPANESSFTLGPAISVTASANDPEGSLVQVEFFADDISLGTDANSPFSVTWNPTTTGTYNLTAKATDGAGASTTSTSIVVNITDGSTEDLTQPYVVSINRQNPTTEITNANIVTYRVTFSEAVRGVDATDFTVTTVSGPVQGSVSSVENIGTTGSIYDVTVSSISGEGILRLDLKNKGKGKGSRITDIAGNAISDNYTSGQSYTIQATDQTAPGVLSINRQSPITEITNASSVIFRATFSEPVNGVDTDDFMIVVTQGNLTASINTATKINTDGTTYDVAVGSIAGSGTMRLDLKSSGTDINDITGNPISGGYTTGQTYTIEQVTNPPLTTTLFSFKSSWKYLDNGTDQGTAWQLADFNDDTWMTGNGKFGYGISDASTVVSYGLDPNNKHVTTYFRKTIPIEDASAFTSYTSYVNVDDGIVVYVNGLEVFRLNMPSGTVSYNTLASSSSGGDDGATPVPFTIPSTAFSNGTNTIAVEIHQYNVSSSDIAFDMELIGNTPSLPPDDQTKPSILSINRLSPITSTTSATTVAYRATFSEDVKGVDVADFLATTVSGTVSGSVTGLVSASTGTTYDITVSSITGEGMLRLDLAGVGTGITDMADNEINGGFTTGEVYDIYIGQSISPLFVTEPVIYDTDDPAIWINNANPMESLIIGTDKNTDGALYVFNMEGSIITDKVVRNLQYPNNVDVAYGLELLSTSMDVAVTTERGTSKLRVFSLPDMLPVDNGGIDVFAGETSTAYNEPMGIALYKRPTDGKVYAIVSRKSGPKDGTYLWQYLLEDDGQGNVTGTLVRKFGQFSGIREIESIAVDNELGYVYYSDETVGVRKYYADPDKGNDELALFATEGFASDQEGISIYKIENGTGYILVADQLDDEIHIYSREGTPGNPHEHQLVKVVKIAAHNIDGTEVANFPIQPHFPNGIFVAMSESKIFHLYRWEDIAGVDLQIQLPQITYTNPQSIIQSDFQEPADKLDKLIVYPNPVKGCAEITIRTGTTEASEVTISDVTGKIIYTFRFSGSTTKPLNLPQGLYFINLSGEKNTIKQKLLVID